MDGVQLIREQLAQTREFINETLADVTPEQAHWQPPGVGTRSARRTRTPCWARTAS